METERQGTADADDGPPLEIELKLSVGDPDVVRAAILEGRPDALAGFEPLETPHVVTQVDRYVDTAESLFDGRLYAAGIKARLREQDGGVVVTVKRDGALAGAVMARTELEEPATADLDPACWPDSSAKDVLVRALAGDVLVEVVALRQRRLTRRIRRGGTEVELSLDELEALHDGTVVGRRWDIEAELKAGDEPPLHDLADALLRLPGVQPPTSSKREWAFRAVAASLGRAVAPRPTPAGDGGDRGPLC